MGRKWSWGHFLPTRRQLLSALATLATVGMWFIYAAPTTLGGPLSLIWVSGLSMEPTLYTGDLAVLYEREQYAVGDIVAFRIPEGGTVIHRIIEVHPDGYRFQGDNRDQVDPWTLDETAIRGQQILSVPQAARAMTWLGQPRVLAALVVAMVVLMGLKPSASPSSAGSEPSPSQSPDPSPSRRRVRVRQNGPGSDRPESGVGHLLVVDVGRRDAVSGRVSHRGAGWAREDTQERLRRPATGKPCRSRQTPAQL